MKLKQQTHDSLPSNRTWKRKMTSNNLDLVNIKLTWNYNWYSRPVFITTRLGLLDPMWSVGPICVWLVWSRCCRRSSRIQNVLSNICTGPSALNFAEISMIFCTQISLVIPECSAKFGPNCSKFHKMDAILNRKNPLLHFSPNLFWLFQWNLVGTLLGFRCTLSANLTWNDLDLWKWPF